VHALSEAIPFDQHLSQRSVSGVLGMLLEC
jgi:hypothetical protein